MNAADEKITKPAKNRTFLVFYIVALFSVAAVIILISYLYNSQLQQAGEELEESRQLSVSALQSVDNLRDDNTALSERLVEAEETISLLEDELEASKLQTEEQKNRAEKILEMLYTAQRELNELTKQYNELLQGEETDD